MFHQNRAADIDTLNTGSAVLDVPDAGPRPETMRLGVGGMTCASCAARIERQLNRVAGVTASVNYATESATVTHPSTFTAADVVGVIVAAGYTASIATPGNDRDDVESSTLARRLLISGSLAFPVVVLAMIPGLQFDGWQWLSLALATPVVTWGALPFHRAAWSNARHASATMDTLISVGTIAAYGWSLYALVLGDAGRLSMRHGFSISPERGMASSQIYLEVAAGVTVFILAGRAFEARARRQSGAALAALGELGAKDVSVLRDGLEARIAVDQLVVGDVFVVRPGEKIATDGIVIHGTSTVDASLITGESAPTEVRPDDSVTGATVNIDGHLTVRATHVGSDTKLAHISRLVTEAQSGKANVQRLADRVAAIFVPIVIAIAVTTLGFWLAAAETNAASTAFTAAVAVLIIACPCALGLATPTALLVGTGRGAQLGILINGPEALESTRTIDMILFDKTGTLTTGCMSLTSVTTSGEISVERALELAGALENASEHPIAKAIVGAAHNRAIVVRPVTGFVNTAGLGVRGDIDGIHVVVGHERFLSEHGMPLDDALRATRDQATAQGQTPVYIGWDGGVRAVLVVADTLKPGAATAIKQLRRLGIWPALITGDNERAAASVAGQVGIDDVFADIVPAEKADIVRLLQAHGRVVAMVGDGVNDAAALAQADLGIAIGAGADLAVAAADITLIRDDLGAIVDAIKLSRRTLATIKANLFWAFAYNLAALPLAAAGLLNPMLAGLAMACSSAIVVSNSLRLRRFDPTKPLVAATLHRAPRRAG